MISARKVEFKNNRKNGPPENCAYIYKDGSIGFAEATDYLTPAQVKKLVKAYIEENGDPTK